MPLGEERRKHIRVFLPGGKVRLLTGQVLALVGKTLDISLGGLKFYSDTIFNVGETLSLEIMIPASLKFKCTAKIIHAEDEARGKVYGVSFIDLGEENKDDLGRYILEMRAMQDNILEEKID